EVGAALRALGQLIGRGPADALLVGGGEDEVAAAAGAAVEVGGADVGVVLLGLVLGEDALRELGAQFGDVLDGVLDRGAGGLGGLGGTLGGLQLAGDLIALRAVDVTVVAQGVDLVVALGELAHEVGDAGLHG